MRIKALTTDQKRPRAIVVNPLETIRNLVCGGGGARRDRTDDLLLAKQALSQLSYGPIRFAGCTFMRGARQGKTGREGRYAPFYLRMGVPGQPFFWLRSREIGRQ